MAAIQQVSSVCLEGMPLAPVDSHGSLLYYEDSGAPEGLDTYTTLVFLHGTGVQGAIFRRLVPFARSAGRRIVWVNQRGYPGSTALYDRDLKLIAPGSSHEDNASFVFARGLEIAEFLVWFVCAERLPARSALNEGDSTQGGFSIVAWSSANTVIMALFGNLSRVPARIRDILEPHLRSYIHYDGTRWSLGYPASNAEHLVAPSTLTKPDQCRDDVFHHFQLWVSAYYHHEDVNSHSISSLTQATATSPLPTFVRMSPEDRAEVSCAAPFFEVEMLLRAVPLSVPERNRNSALYGRSDRVDDLEFWPDVAVKMLQCEKSLWEVISALWEMQDTYEVHKRAGRPVRKMEFHLLSEANHFAHWDEPEKTIGRLLELA